MTNSPLRPVARPKALLWTVPLTLAVASTGLGCFRATGIARPSLAVEEIPSTGGDRVAGLKATAGPGDFYLGNDYVQLAVDGAVFGDRDAQFGARSGGAILDAGVISLDQSYHRQSPPTDMLERLGPVVNQDPDLPLVFDRFAPGTATSLVFLDMSGYLLDPLGKLGVATDAQNRVPGVTVTHRISLGTRDTYYTLETTLTNNSGATLGIQNLGDYLSQHGGGFRFAVPATGTSTGAPLSSPWGVTIPGSDFSTPVTAVATSVQAPMVALMGSEASGETLDSHGSLGFLPVDSDLLLVASDPQFALTESRTRVPARLVVGGLPVANLAAGAALTYRRRMYVVGGASTSSSLPSQATTMFNELALTRAALRGGNLGIFQFDSFGTAARGGPLQTEYLFERYLGTAADPTVDAGDGTKWMLERVEWREPFDLPASGGGTTVLLPAVPDPNRPGQAGQNQLYRITAKNASTQIPPETFILYKGINRFSTDNTTAAVPLQPSKDLAWSLAEALAPERASVVDAGGNIVTQRQTAHIFTTREAGSTYSDGLQPLRMTFLGVGATPDPLMQQRTRRLAAYYSPVYKGKVPGGVNYGSYQYQAENQVFGTSFSNPNSSLGRSFPAGDYLAYGSRGPLSYLDAIPVKAFAGQADIQHQFVVVHAPLPAGWTAFDVPGPTQATTGGLNPGEMLSSALAEGVQVLARTEEDQLHDPTVLRTEFRSEFEGASLLDGQRTAIAADPFIVGARSATLVDGFTTALFTPAPLNLSNGGARSSKGWTLADFLAQADGGFNIVHHPAGSQGLFTVRGWDPTKPLTDVANAWWGLPGPISLGKLQGEFDALELIRGDYSDATGSPRPLTVPANATAWFTEFLNARQIWFSLLSQQNQGSFTKALGLSSSRYSLDTPVGLARTYLNLGSSITLNQADLSPVLTALKHGAAVASTGPLLDVTINGVGPGGLVSGPTASTLTLNISLWAPDWVPIDEVRVVINKVVQVVPMSSFLTSTTDPRLRTASLSITMPVGTDAWVVVEAGVPLSTSGAYAPALYPAWPRIMKGIYPIAVTNPIFVDVTGGGYTPPGL